MDKVIIVSGPVIIKDNKVLLDISGVDDFWKFCGGRLKEDETLKETAIRRAKEELDIDVSIINDEPFFMYVKKINSDIVLVHWLSKSKGKIKLGKGVKKFAWFDVDKLPKNLGPNIEIALKHFKIIKK